MRIAILQMNTIVGDVHGNVETILRGMDWAKGEKADVCVAPELAVVGYPPLDLLGRDDLIEANLAAVSRIAAEAGSLTTVVGYVRRAPEGPGKPLQNAAAVCRGGKVVASYAKMLLPTYSVFDESRYFRPGEEACVFEIPAAGGTVRAALSICEDLWGDEQFVSEPLYGRDPTGLAVEGGAEVLINLSASPFRMGVGETRRKLFGGQAKRNGVPIVYVNQCGAHDHLIFDGASGVFDAKGELVVSSAAFEQVHDLYELDAAPAASVRGPSHPYPEDVESVRLALSMGIRDYVGKCGFSDVAVGLSGGIDSAVTAALAVEALGASHVHGVAMPSRYSSAHSVSDAEALAANLGIDYECISIGDAHDAIERALAPRFAGTEPGIAEENVQARIRGNLLMALANKFGWMILTTGNKSELAVGYCTLYGDMSGALAVLADVPKTLVYSLAEEINRSGREVIPRNTIEKPPSAELRENQVDQDSLPPYNVLDGIIERYVERDWSAERIVADGFDAATVDRVLRLIDRNEYKRYQAAISLRVTSRAFGMGRRMPVAARPRGYESRG